MTFVDRIRWQCRMRPEKPALSLPGSSRATVSYGQLSHHLDSVRRKLSEVAIVPGAVYGLLMTDPLLHVVLTLALEELGAATMFLNDLDIPHDWKLSAIFSDREIAKSNWPIQRVHANWLHGDSNDARPNQIRTRSPDDICCVILTSGSTGNPKAVALTHRVRAQRIARLDYALGSGFAHHTRMLCCLTPSTEFGYRCLIRTLSRGGLFCFPNASIVSTARKVSFYGVQTLVASAATLAEFLKVAQEGRTGFHSLELIVTAGSLLPKALADSVRDKICGRIVNTYGSTEAGGVATAPVEMLDLDNGEVGFVNPGIEVDVVDAETRAPLKDRGGRLRIRSEGVARGYLGASNDDGIFDDNAFYADDLGYLSADGRLSLYGRNNSVVNLGGDKTSLERIEALYSAAPGVNDLTAAVVSDGLGLNRVIAVVVPSTDWSEQAFWDHCERHIQRAFWPSKLLTVEALPRSANGKLDRRKVEALVEPIAIV